MKNRTKNQPKYLDIPKIDNKAKVEFSIVKEKYKKRQIVLCHSTRYFENYYRGLFNRMNGNYNKVPSYFVKKNGEVIENFNPKYRSEYMGNHSLDKRNIVVCLENIGWLVQDRKRNRFMNWVGDIYYREPFEKRWRNHLLWDPYTEEQYEALRKLLITLTVKFSIPYELTGHNVKLRGVNNFEGIVSKSNYSEYSTDLNPSFEFEKIEI